MHIYKMPNGKWRVVVQDERRRRSKVTATQREAKLAGAQLAIELGKQPDPVGQTVGDLIDLHLNLTPRAKTTVKDHEYLVAKIPGWMLEWRVQNVTTMMVSQAYHQLQHADGWTPHRVRRLHEILRPAFDRAAIWGWVPNNPVIPVKPPPKPEVDMDVPAPAAVTRLVDAAFRFKPDFGCAILITSRTGIRRGELCALQWDDIDEASRTINIRRSLSTTTGDAHHERRGKIGKAGHRIIPVPPEVIMAIRAHRTRMAAQALDHGHPLTKWVFTVDGQRPWRTDYVTLALARLQQDQDDPIHIHQLRHFAATQWIGAGIDPKTVSHLLGHTNVSTTLNIYTAYLPTKGQEAADVMARIFANGGT